MHYVKPKIQMAITLFRHGKKYFNLNKFILFLQIKFFFYIKELEHQNIIMLITIIFQNIIQDN